MKRSMMVEIIANRLNARNSGHYSYDAKEHAELVLKAIEDAGMLPPNIHRCMSHDCEHTQEYKWSKE